jgi:diphthamide biosynthesis methyltransferase
MTEQNKYRITILRGSGSVWVEDYTSIAGIVEDLEELMDKYPHLVISRQKFFVKEDEENE